jgi:hypothetical protein
MAGGWGKGSELEARDASEGSLARLFGLISVEDDAATSEFDAFECIAGNLPALRSS